ncbi:MAG: hypothetical protein L7H04_02010 [Vulcanisaeta sp.]|nr:hypothetical protein [Vulcanisaeta sp.]
MLDEELVDSIARGLWVLVKFARGTIVVFDTKKLLYYAGVNTKQLPLDKKFKTAKILHILANENFISIYERRKKKTYYKIDPTTTAWRLIRVHNASEELLKKEIIRLLKEKYQF